MSEQVIVSPEASPTGGAEVPSHKPRQFRHITCVVSETREHGSVCHIAVTGDLKEVKLAQDKARELARETPGTAFRPARLWPATLAKVVTKTLFVEVSDAAPSSAESAEASAGTVAPATAQGDPETPAHAEVAPDAKKVDAEVKDLF
jgi:hypothetical protein